MSVFELSHPCWIGLWQGPGIQNRLDGPHYATPENVPSFDEHPGRASMHKGCGGVIAFGLGNHCVTCEAENIGDGGIEDRDYLPGQLPVACLQAQCDGGCGAILGEDDDTGVSHFADLAEVRRAAHQAGWVITAAGQVFCPADLPAEIAEPDLPTTAEQEAAGQLPLPGLG